MTASDIVTIINSGGGWVAILWIFFKEVLPKIAPAYAKAINKNQTREDRLFEILAETNKQNAKLSAALESLTDAFKDNTRRLEKVEDSTKRCHLTK